MRQGSGACLTPASQRLPKLDNVILENPSTDGPFHEGDRRDGQQRTTASEGGSSARRGRPLDRAVARRKRALPSITARAQIRRDGECVVCDKEISLRSVSRIGGAGFLNTP